MRKKYEPYAEKIYTFVILYFHKPIDCFSPLYFDPSKIVIFEVYCSDFNISDSTKNFFAGVFLIFSRQKIFPSTKRVLT